MSKQERLAYRILASMYPDRRPSEVRKIIEDAMAKEENIDDIELWELLCREKSEEKKEETKVVERVVEHHHYHGYGYYYNATPVINDHWTITCNGDTVNPCGSDSATYVSLSDMIY